MKKTTCTTLMLALCISTTCLAQSLPSKRELRKQQKELKQNTLDSLLTAAIANQNFTFKADYITQEYTGKLPIKGANNLIFVTPENLRVLLPYYSTTQSRQHTPLLIDFDTNEFSYTYQTTRKGMFKVKIIADNVQNNQSNAKMQSGRYIIELEISPKTGNTYVMITPNFSANITYTGVCSVNRAF
ncbi:MAG: DUF4251 domain-containing protein [Rikenellaceae bacterium]